MKIKSKNIKDYREILQFLLKNSYNKLYGNAFKEVKIKKSKKYFFQMAIALIKKPID